jgi:hypothetical protein
MPSLPERRPNALDSGFITGNARRACGQLLGRPLTAWSSDPGSAHDPPRAAEFGVAAAAGRPSRRMLVLTRSASKPGFMR